MHQLLLLITALALLCLLMPGFVSSCQKVRHKLDVLLVFEALPSVLLGMALLVVCPQKLLGLEGLQTELALAIVIKRLPVSCLAWGQERLIGLQSILVLLVLLPQTVDESLVGF